MSDKFENLNNVFEVSGEIVSSEIEKNKSIDSISAETSNTEKEISDIKKDYCRNF